MSYNIAATDCGKCPNATANMFIRCTNLTFDGKTCVVVIQAMTCENSFEHSGTASLKIFLKGNVMHDFCTFDM